MMLLFSKWSRLSEGINDSITVFTLSSLECAFFCSFDQAGCAAIVTSVLLCVRDFKEGRKRESSVLEKLEEIFYSFST